MPGSVLERSLAGVAACQATTSEHSGNRLHIDISLTHQCVAAAVHATADSDNVSRQCVFELSSFIWSILGHVQTAKHDITDGRLHR